MTLVRYSSGDPHVLAADENLIRFPMTDGQRVIACEIHADVMRAEFGEDGSAPLDVFMKHRDTIEAAANRGFDSERLAVMDNYLLDVTTNHFAGTMQGGG